MTAEERCRVCGKKGKRPCPALGGWICPACCGSQRGSKINCARDCEFFPYGVAGSEAWGKIDGAWVLKGLDYVLAHLNGAEFNRIRSDGAIRTSEPNLDQEASLSNAIYFSLFHRRDSEGKTLADLWESQGWKGLNNDEQVMMRFRRRSLATVIEIQRKVDSRTTECVDLFEHEPRPFLLFDRALAESAPRFSRLFVRLTHFPHFSRTSGLGYPIPLPLWPVWKDIIQSWTTQTGPAQPGLTVREFLSENEAKAVGLIAQVSEAYRLELNKSMDTHQCLAFYDLSGACAEVENILTTRPDFQAAEPPVEPEVAAPRGFFHWVRLGESVELAQGLPDRSSPGTPANQPALLGYLSLYPDGLMVETFSLPKYQVARKMIDTYFGGLVRFQREKIVDLAKQNLEHRAAESALLDATRSSGELTSGENSDSTDVPPSPEPGSEPPARMSPEVERRLIQELHEKKYAAFLDETIPALDGATPRAAAQDPALRPKLIEVMKVHLHNLERENQRTGLGFDLNTTLDVLGLPELK